jgi:transposase-like protein
MVRASKFAGYCPSCKLMLSQLDLELGKKSIYNCAGCGKRLKRKDLLQELNREKYESKKDYLTSKVLDYGYDVYLNVSTTHYKEKESE